jgi:signal transduction histidine kinase
MAYFKTRARALDLLGKQQIAGIPTAISELFKNAHDAYADKVEIDYFRKDKLLILRDDGLGMTVDEFLQRWLTLGTESKYSKGKMLPPPIDKNKTRRPIMGEKGIGRLAIAALGEQVFILSRAERDGELENFTLALINWKIFELPGLDLEDIFIPVTEFSSEEIPPYFVVNDLKTEFLDNLIELYANKKIDKDDYEYISNAITNFNIDPNLLNKKLPPLSVDGNKRGTSFYISPTDETLNYAIDGFKDDKGSAPLERMLNGFSNTMTPNHKPPFIDAAFRDYRGDDDKFYNLIDKEEFFTPNEFVLADHQFYGDFDEYGQFTGKIKVYNEREFDHKIVWDSNNFKKTACGPFRIDVAYLQGMLRQSILPKEEHARLISKVDKYGGLYIYKDGIRILPYGLSDNDFIDIEKRRTKSASYYFFSYRRVFGAVSINAKDNDKLVEKAGREGFVENAAYKHLREILMNFFIQLAADFFREGGGPKAEFWIEKRKERESFYKAIEKREKRAKEKKAIFSQRLNTFFDKLSRKEYSLETNNLLLEIERNFNSVAYIEDKDEASSKLLDYEIEAREKLNLLRNSWSVNEPKGFATSREQREDFEAYLQEFDKILIDTFLPAEEKIDEFVETYKEKLQLEISKRKRLESAVKTISEDSKKIAKQKETEAKKAADELSNKVKKLANELMIDLQDTIRNVSDEFKKYELLDKQDFDLVLERRRLEEVIVNEREKNTTILESIINQLEGIYWEKDNKGYITNDQIQNSIEEEIAELKDKLTADVELSQLGLAVGVIHHEFESTIKVIRKSIKDLKAWADVNENMEGLYENIKLSFDHLDSYLNLFTPLNRRLQRSRTNIKCLDVKIFLLDLFKARLERHNIKLKHTKGFEKRSFYGFHSTFYPVYVNIVDNAIYWLKQYSTKDEKVIRLHADDEGFYISNNGTEISPRDIEKIFDLGFTRKLKGRGMGLHISREVLNAEGWNIILDEPKQESSVTFKIYKEKNDE